MLQWMAATNIELEFAERGFAPELAGLSRDLIEAGLGWTYRADRIRALINDPNVVTIVARDDRCIVGFAVMHFADERAHLVLLAVRPTYQRKGIARRMIEWLEKSALVAGIASIQVEVRANNVAALAFYRAVRFTTMRNLVGYYRGREGAVRMLRILRSSVT